MDILNKVIPHSSKILIGIIILICIIVFAVGMNTPTAEPASYKISLSVAAVTIAATGVIVFVTSKFLDNYKTSPEQPVVNVVPEQPVVNVSSPIVGLEPVA